MVRWNPLPFRVPPEAIAQGGKQAVLPGELILRAMVCRSLWRRGYRLASTGAGRGPVVASILRHGGRVSSALPHGPVGKGERPGNPREIVTTQRRGRVGQRVRRAVG